MSKYGGTSSFFFVSGYDWLAAKLKGFSLKLEALMEEASGASAAYESHTPTGATKATLTQTGGFWDTTTANVHAVMASGLPTTPQTAARVACIGYMGQSVGALFYGISGDFTTAYEALIESNKLTKANVSHVISGKVEPGIIVQPLATKTVDWNTKTLGTVTDYTLDPSQVVIPITSATKANPCVVTTAIPHGRTTGDIVFIASNTLTGTVINGERTITVISTTTVSVAVNTSGSGGAGTGGTVVRANSTNGAAGYQQVTAFTGFTGYVGKLRDSADDTTYADLLSFTNVTATAAAERVTVAGTVDRYICHDGDVTGSGSLDVMSGVARL